ARVARVVGDGGGVAAGLVLDDLDAEAVGPDRELVDRGGTERVARAEQHRLALVAEVLAQLGDARRLARAVDADDEDHGRTLGRVANRPVGLRPARGDALLEKRQDFLGLADLAGLPAGADLVAQAVGRVR